MSPTTRQRLVLVVLTAVQIAVAALLLDGLSRIHGWSAVHGEDSESYLLVARHFAGEETAAADLPLLRYRLFNPLIPALAGLLGHLIGIEAAFLCLNVLFWMLAVLAFHELLRRWDPEVALLGGALLTTSLPLIEWGLPIMLDAGAYFFAASTVLLYLHTRQDGWRSGLLLGLWAGLALLVKPTLLALVLFVGLACLCDRRPVKGAVAGLAAAGVALACYLLQGLTVADFLSFGSPRHRGLVYLVSAAVFCFHWGWLPFAAGWRARPGERFTYGLYLLATVPLYLVFVHSPRLFFLSYVGVLPLVARGLHDLGAGRPRLRVALAAGYVLTSNLLAAFHLFVMRTLGIRSWEQLLDYLR